MSRPGQFQPGRSGNPAGRLKGIERQLRELLGDDLPKIALAMRNIALGRAPEGTFIEVKGSDCTKAAEWIYNRCYGQPKQTIDLTADVTEHAPIDWSTVPLERRREMLEVLNVVGALETADGDDTEH